jgi:EAL domain-containing protein (putative c-di-GMP-specific phosphodiesterase class I)
MKSVCVGCRDDVALPFEFKMAFRPIVDLTNSCVWGYEALLRGAKGESAFSILS